MEELGLSGVTDLNGKLQHNAPTRPPKIQGLIVTLKSKIGSVSTAGLI